MIEFSSPEVRLIEPEETWPIRAAVLWPEMDEGPECLLIGDLHADTFHLGAVISGKVVSVASFMRQEQPEYPGIPAYRVRAMGTSSDHRGMGAGRAVLEMGLELLSDRQCERIWCDARHVALGFYAKLDWDVTGASFEVPLRGAHRRASRVI